MTTSTASTGPATGQEAVDGLVGLLDLETLEVNLFRGISPPHSLPRVFGGQVAAQALVAAGRTVPEDREVHSLHAYFIRPGDPAVPIVYETERVRDGRSFTTRRVLAIQHGVPIFSLSASFQLPQTGLEHTQPAPDGRARAGHAARARRARLVGGRAVAHPGPAAARHALREPAAVVGRVRGRLRGARAGLDARRRQAARRPPAARLHAHLRQRPHVARLGAGPPRPRRGSGADGQPRPRHVVPPPVPRRRVAALHVLLAVRGRRAGPGHRPLHPGRRHPGGHHRAGGPGPGRGSRHAGGDRLPESDGTPMPAVLTAARRGGRPGPRRAHDLRGLG